MTENTKTINKTHKAKTHNKQNINTKTPQTVTDNNKET
jgi:hypothetical protein